MLPASPVTWSRTDILSVWHPALAFRRIPKFKNTYTLYRGLKRRTVEHPARRIPHGIILKIRNRPHDHRILGVNCLSVTP